MVQKGYLKLQEGNSTSKLPKWPPEQKSSIRLSRREQRHNATDQLGSGRGDILPTSPQPTHYPYPQIAALNIRQDIDADDRERDNRDNSTREDHHHHHTPPPPPPPQQQQQLQDAEVEEQYEEEDRIETTTASSSPAVEAMAISWKNLINTGVEKSRIGLNNEALECFQAALKAQRKIAGEQDSDHIANTLANIGSVHLKQGRLFLAAEALEEALSMKKKMRDFQVDENGRNKIELVNVLNNLGNVAFLRDNYSLSLKYYKESVEEARKSEANSKSTSIMPNVGLANVLYNLGRLYVLKGEWDDAIAVLNDALTVPEEMEHDGGTKNDLLADTMELIGFAYLSSDDLDNALIYFSEALSICQGDKRVGKQAENPRAAISLVHVAMVLEKRGQTKQAWRAYTAARDIFAKLGVDGDHQCYRAARRSIASLEKDVEFTTTGPLLQAGISRDGNHNFLSVGRNSSNHNFMSIEVTEDREGTGSIASNVQQPLRYQTTPEEEPRERMEAANLFQCV